MLRRTLVAATTAVALLAGCTAGPDPAPVEGPRATPTGPSEAPAEGTAAGAEESATLMPDLKGMGLVQASEALGEVEVEWGRSVAVRCGARPRTVVRQSPAAGTALGADTVVRVRTASMDLDRFRGPCEPQRESGGEHTAADLALARTFYEFAADPARGAPFSAAGVWVGIEDGVRSQFVRGEELRDLEAWEIEASYAEGSGPFSALDMAAASGGYYDVSGTIPRTCPNGNDAAPPELVGLRVVTLAAAEDLVTSCMEWWAVTLFVEPDGRIAGVALRHGAP